MQRLCELDPAFLDEDGLDLLDTLLGRPMDEWEDDATDFTQRYGSAGFLIAPAIYFAGVEQQDRAHDGEAGPYTGEYLREPEDQRQRLLHRVGGVPTTVPGVDTPDSVFLMQVDLLCLHDAFSWDESIASFLEDSLLPSGGVLQLFHTTTGDSTTDPFLRGGGAQVLHLPETQLRDRDDPRLEATDYPVSLPSPSVFPTFALASRREADTDLAVSLQNEADRAAGLRGGVDVPTHRHQTAPRWSRILGLPDLSYGLDDGDRDVLKKELPLSGDDRHVLLFNLASDRQFDGVFGDGGRLEVWMRRTDLAEARFSEVVSFLRSP
ncbi:hypothetical protein MMM2322_02802 [Microbacterium sp. MM2322]